jgi:hypothetical protein
MGIVEFPPSGNVSAAQLQSQEFGHNEECSWETAARLSSRAVLEISLQQIRCKVMWRASHVLCHVDRKSCTGRWDEFK